MLYFNLLNIETREVVFKEPIERSVLDTGNIAGMFEAANKIAAKINVSIPTIGCVFNNDSIVYEYTLKFGAEVFKEDGAGMGGVLPVLYGAASVDPSLLEETIVEEKIEKADASKLEDHSDATFRIETKECATAGNWDANDVTIRNPISIQMTAEPGIFDVRSFYLRPLTLTVVGTLHGKDIILGTVDTTPFSDNTYELPLAKNGGYYKYADGVYYIPTSEYANIENIRLETNDEQYTKIQNIDVCWNVNFRNNVYTTRAVVKKALMMFTNYAYTLASKEFELFIRNVEKFLGRKIYKFEKYAGTAHIVDPKLLNARVVASNERPLSEVGWDLSTEEKLKEFFDILGVRNDTYSGLKRTTFQFALDYYANVAGVTSGDWDNQLKKLQLGGGWSFSIRPEDFISNRAIPLSSLVMHEMGHVFGYLHYTEFCNLNFECFECAVPTFVDLMVESGLAPYKDELEAVSTPTARCGFNPIEMFILKNPDIFKDTVAYKWLLDSKDERNKNYDTIMPKIKKWESEMSNPFLKLAALAASNYKAAIDVYLTPRDRELYKNANSAKYLTKF